MPYLVKTRGLAAMLLFALAGSACGDDGTPGAGSPTTTTAQVAADSTTTTAQVTADSTTTTAPAGDCPTAQPVPALAPVEPDTAPLPLEEDLPLAAGRYRHERLGVSLAFDMPDGFRIPYQFGPNLGFEADGGFLTVLRPAGFATAFRSRDALAPLVELDTWLADVPSTVEEDTIEVDGQTARDLTITLAGDEGVPLTQSFGIQPEGGLPKRLIVVDLGDPLVVLAEPLDPADPTVLDAALALVGSLAIGDTVDSYERTFADTPWDVGIPLRKSSVGSCTIPLVAFGGSHFELDQPARIWGAGDEVVLEFPDVDHVGIGPPTIFIQRPAVLLGTPVVGIRRGAAVDSVDTAIAQLESEGFALSPVESDATLLGAPTRTFDFVAPDQPNHLWIAHPSPVSSGSPNRFLEAGRAGTIHFADTDQGVVVAMVEGEAGTDDVELIRATFDTVVATLALRG